MADQIRAEEEWEDALERAGLRVKTKEDVDQE